MRTACLTLAALLLAAHAWAQAVPAPTIVPGDSWVFESTVQSRAGWHQTRIETTVLRDGPHWAGPAEIEISSKPVGSTMPPHIHLTGADWSRVRSIAGHEQVVNRPLAFPLEAGKSWVVDYSEAHPNRQFARQHTRSVYRVMGWEDVTVPAGRFHALKIEADGTWSGVLAASVSAGSSVQVDNEGATTLVQSHRTTPAEVGGRTYKAFWYVPAVKKWVRSVEEYYDSGGTLNEHYEDALIAFTPAR